MRIGKWIAAIAVTTLLSGGSIALAQGKGHGKGHDKHGDDDQDAAFYKDHDREVLRGWYSEHGDQLPPGLAKKDRLPPGLEKQLVRRGTLPPGLQKRLQPCPEELERRLPPPPPDCAHVVIGGHLVLLNRKTNIIVDVFHFEIG
jgi:Ni/Co efflux regulator RcnB